MSHWVSENEGSRIILVPGWPQTAEASGGMGERLRLLMEPLAERVDGGAVEDYVMEEQPGLLARRLLDFFKSVEGSER
jgi:hypothetical protein